MSPSIDTSMTDQRIADLRRILSLPEDQIGKAKGSAPGLWKDTVANLLGDASAAVDQELEDARGRLPSRVIAAATVQAWETMPPARRKNYLEWIEGLDAKKATVHRITLAAGLVHMDPQTSQTQLASVSLESKENVARLADELLNRHSEELNELFPADALLYKVFKTSQCLVQIAAHEKTAPLARYHTLRNCLVALHRHLREGKSMFNPVFDSAARVLDGFPSNLYRQLDEDLRESAPELHSRFFPGTQIVVSTVYGLASLVTSESPAPLAPVTPDSPVHLTPSSTGPQSLETNSKVRVAQTQPPLVETSKSRPPLSSSNELVQLFDDASRYVSTVEQERDRLRAELSSKLSLLESLNATLAVVREERDATLERLTKADSTAATLTFRIGELSDNLQKEQEKLNLAWTAHRDIESRAAFLDASVADLTREKLCLSEEAAKEKEALARQVQGTAETRIDEIKKDIGFAIRRVVRDVPDKSTKVSPESAQRILIRLHEVLYELERRGIRVKAD